MNIHFVSILTSWSSRLLGSGLNADCNGNSFLYTLGYVHWKLLIKYVWKPFSIKHPHPDNVMHVRVHIILLPLFILRINGFISEIERIHLGKHARLSYIFSVIACTSDWRHVGSTLSWLEHVSGAVNGDVDPTNIECYKSINFQVPSPSPPLCTIRPSSPPSVFVLITCESSSSLLPCYDHIASAIVRGANNSLHVGGIPYTCISMQNAVERSVM